MADHESAAETPQEYGYSLLSQVLSAHRTPDQALDCAATAADRGTVKGVDRCGRRCRPSGQRPGCQDADSVLGVPMPSKHLMGLDSLLSMVQMPGGIPVATFAVGEAGATNAALFAVSILALGDAAVPKNSTSSASTRPRKCSPRPCRIWLDRSRRSLRQ
ncbi:MAG: AIR carboxylase family protein [Betaproteobacteria bacterium]|nr:AIR carboxylase family protein [Candidatus Dechloromonas phosphorivorans]